MDFSTLTSEEREILKQTLNDAKLAVVDFMTEISLITEAFAFLDLEVGRGDITHEEGWERFRKFLVPSLFADIERMLDDKMGPLIKERHDVVRDTLDSQRGRLVR